MIINVQFTAESTEDLVNQMMLFVNKFDGVKIIPLSPKEANYEEVQEAEETAEGSGEGNFIPEAGRGDSEAEDGEASGVDTVEAVEIRE